jgi:hypothetical protein
LIVEVVKSSRYGVVKSVVRRDGEGYVYEVSGEREGERAGDFSNADRGRIYNSGTILVGGA